MPSNRNLNIYVFLLKLSKDYIKQSIDDYENRKHLAILTDDYHKLYYAINYHMFTSSQLMYCIYERLEIDYPSNKKEIEKFFKRSGNAVYSVIIIANNIKHGQFDLTPIESITVEVDDYSKPIKVTHHKAVRILTTNEKNNKEIELLLENKKLKGEKISQIFEKSYEELVSFLDLNKYEY